MPEAWQLRPARKDDAEALARLIDIAGEGFGTHFWAQAAGPGESALDVGIRRAQREEGGFSYRNATVAESGGRIAGLLLGYPLADPYDAGDLAALPDMVRPLVALEAEAPGSWYINALATFPEFRGKGLGSLLLSEAEQIAREARCKQLSIIVADENEGAKRLYLRTEYTVVARRPLVAFPGFPHGGDWVLMTKPAA
ncbi:MAG: GNAT family N-acetyltransferase [Bradyrhizobiaceae bacterium]|nr:GNAT family N-acetyltransferase [Bradyrhizobiaceae bacterium]